MRIQLILIVMTFFLSLNKKNNSQLNQPNKNDLMVHCSFKQWMSSSKYSTRTLKIDIPDETSRDSLNNNYYLSWEANCLILLSTYYSNTILKIPLLVRESQTNCGQSSGIDLFDHYCCRFNESYHIIWKGALDMKYTLKNKETETYEITHKDGKGFRRIFNISFKDSTISMRTEVGSNGIILEY